MGVAGLLRLLQPISEQRQASHYQGKTLGVDGYSWLHRAAASCAEDLLKGVASPRLVQSIDNRVRVYERNGVDLYFVFDGSSLAMKERVEQQRRRVREAARTQSSNSSGSFASANNVALRGVDITANHAAMVIAYLKVRGIKFVVAPYEADAQLVYLESQGLIDGIISEDSDMLVFGAQTLLTKSDSKTGECIEVCGNRMPAPLTDLQCLRSLAIVSGCDYSPGVAGMGPVKTKAMITRFGGRLPDIVDNLVDCQRVEPEFHELARQANLAFQFQRVWNPVKCCITYMNEPDEGELAQLSDGIVGTQLSRAVAHRLAIGMLDPSDQQTELVVDPVIARYVQRMRPVREVKPSVYSTPMGVSRAINRRLQTSPTGGPSPSTPSPQAHSISRFFKPAVKPTPPVQKSEKENLMMQGLPTPSQPTPTRSNITRPSFSLPTPGMDSSSGLKRTATVIDTASKMMRTDTIIDGDEASTPTKQRSSVSDSRLDSTNLDTAKLGNEKFSMIQQFAYRPS